MKNIICIKCLKEDKINDNEVKVNCKFCNNELNTLEATLFVDVNKDYLKRLSEDTKDLEYSDKFVLMYKLGMYYYDEKDYDNAFKFIELASKYGNVDAINKMGTLYFYGYGCKINKAKGADYYKTATKEGSVEAKCSLAYCYQYGFGIEQNHEEALKLYHQAASDGLGRAKRQIGMLYEHGRIEKQDYSKAVKWYKEASDLNDAVAQNELGNLYYSGIGVKQDYKEAFKYHEMSAKNGEKVAQLHLGCVYESGKGVAVNLESSFYWIEKAASQGDDDALYILGTYYESGTGTTKDRIKAFDCYKKSAELNHMYAKKAMLRLKSSNKNGKVVKTISGWKGPAEIEIDLENIISLDSHLEVLRKYDDIRFINKNMSSTIYAHNGDRKYGYDANVLVVNSDVTKITNATFHNVGTLVYLGNKAFTAMPAFKLMKVKEVIFIKSGFLSGFQYLIEGCKYIIENFESFNDKENFIKTLKKKTDKIKQLVLDLSNLNSKTKSFLEEHNISISKITVLENAPVLFDEIDFSAKEKEVLEVLSKHPYLKNIEIKVSDSKVITYERVYSPSPYYASNGKLAQTLVLTDEVEFIGSLAFKKIQNFIFVGKNAMPSYNLFKKYKEKIDNIIFINSEFLKGKFFLVEGSVYIINNFDEFTDKENFIKTLQKKTDKIKFLIFDLISYDDSNIIEFLINNNIAKYELLLGCNNLNISLDNKMLIMNAIDNTSDSEKKKHKANAQRKEDIDTGVEQYTLKDLKVKFACVKKENHISLSKYKAYDESIVIPANVDNINKFEIKYFGKEYSIKKIYFEEGIKEITLNYEKDKKGFQGLESLCEIYLPSTLEYIDDKFFSYVRNGVVVHCNNKDNGENVIQKGDFIIKGGKILHINHKKTKKDFIIPNGIEVINAYEFSNCRQIETMILPDSIKVIGEHAFNFCRGITEIKLPSKLEEIKHYAFFYCDKIKEFNISSNVHTIGDLVFVGCTAKFNIEFKSKPSGWSSETRMIEENIKWGVK